MTDEQAGLVTQMLKQVSAGDPRAASELLPLVYAELRKLAQSRMAKTPPGNTLQPTALVHEAYMRMVGSDAPSWNSRGHFFAAAAQAMRQILVEQVRRKASLKRGGEFDRVSVDPGELAIAEPSEDILALDEALKELEKRDPRKAQLVNLRFFAGLTTEEAAAALGISVPTAERDWRFVKALLHSQLSGTDSSPRE
ncbi:RNA polymerase subunit sigma [cyanobacterium TDX16]|nr:RNA polymerase subunit sigma [cyanobacterium TDX16]